MPLGYVTDELTGNRLEPAMVSALCSLTFSPCEFGEVKTLFLTCKMGLEITFALTTSSLV